jgi:CHAT domain-containing protein
VILKRLLRRNSFLLLALLFIISTAIPVFAKVPSQVNISVQQTQQDGRLLTNKAIGLYRQSRFEEAAKLWQAAAVVFRTQGDNLNQAMALSNLALTYQQLGQPDQAKKDITKSLEILKNKPESQEKSKTLAQVLDIQGYLQREMGQSDDALNTWIEASKIYSEIKAPEKLAQNKINQAQAMQDLGLYPRACKTVLEVLDKMNARTCQELSDLKVDDFKIKLAAYNKNESPSLKTVLALRNLSESLRFIGQLKYSRLAIEAGIDITKQLNYPLEQAENYLSLGNTIQALEDAEPLRRIRTNYQQEAFKIYPQVVQLSPSSSVRQQAQLNQLSLLLKLDKLSEAETLWTSLKSQLVNLPPSRTNLYLQLNFAHSLIKIAQKDKDQNSSPNPQESLNSPPSLIGKRGRGVRSSLPTFQEIEEILIQANTQAKLLGDKSAEAYAVGYRGGLYEISKSNQDLSKAETFTKEALNIASTFESSDIAYQFFWQLGRIYKEKEQIEDAIAAYTKAYNALQLLRSDLVAVNPEIQFTFRDSVEPIYRQLVQLDLESADSLNKAKTNQKSQERLKQARTVLESLQLAEINNFFREACVKVKSETADKVDPTAAVIYTVVLPDKLGVIFSAPNKPLVLHTVDVKQDVLENTIKEVRGSLGQPQSSEQLLERQEIFENQRLLYSELYKWLVEPFEAELAANPKVKNLAFVLDGELRNVPMSILYNPKTKEYLVQKFAIAVAPALQLVDPKPITAIGDLRALTAGLSETRPDLESHKGFGELQNVKLELENIQKLGISSQPILNKQFLSTTIRNALTTSRFPIIHLATHARFSSDVDNTFILDWDGKINVKDLNKLLQSTQINQRVPIELLVLSACETASGDKRAALGLAGVAIRAGARSTLATLWPVEDKSTAELMGKFYSELKETKKNNTNRIQALQKAQLSLLDSKSYSHPHYWAPFVLVGNWQ